ncbi:hypothetical protein GGI07_005122 [Coemansia sp. Benny D115]|nr:hypothetical protein GGI07_005122 [Coemansia sp. Benny D115]
MTLKARLARQEFVAYLERTHREVNSEDLYAYCGRNRFSKEYIRSVYHRYQNLTQDVGRIFVAVNLHNSRHILPNMAMQILELADVLGHQNLYISVYENGSTDQTKDILGAFGHVLQAMGITHSVVTADKPLGGSRHRIEYMAELRNQALAPFYTNKGEYDKVLFLNDIFFCLPDVLELMLQSKIQRSHLTCGEDFVLRHGALRFYDTWVARDILGHAFKGRHQEIAQDGYALVSQMHGRPFQVQCCWNGMAVIDSSVFKTPSPIRFRRSGPSECSASECSLFCNDMWSAGFTRAVVVPRVKVSYAIETRDLLKLPANFPRDAPFRPGKLKEIAYRPGPESVYCHPLNSPGVHTPDGPASFVAVQQ